DGRHDVVGAVARARHGLRQLRARDRSRSCCAGPARDRHVRAHLVELQRLDVCGRRLGDEIPRRRRDVDAAAATRRISRALLVARRDDRGSVPRRLQRRRVRRRSLRAGVRVRDVAARRRPAPRADARVLDAVRYGVVAGFIPRLAVAWGVNALALWIANALWDSVSIHGWAAYLIGSAVLGIANALIKPIVALITLPLI